MTNPDQNTEPKEAPIDEDLLMGDHEYDGIQEYDNPLPRWWTLIFWGTFIFSIGYILYYHTSDDRGVLAAYAAEASAAQANAPPIAEVTEEALAAVVADSAAVAAGKEVYTARCAACHGDKAEGKIGPNLTDHHWIHGKGTLKDLYQSVAVGVPAKGMPAWAKQLSPKEMQDVVGYVGSVKGTMVSGRAAEGTEHAPK